MLYFAVAGAALLLFVIAVLSAEEVGVVRHGSGHRAGDAGGRDPQVGVDEEEVVLDRALAGPFHLPAQLQPDLADSLPPDPVDPGPPDPTAGGSDDQPGDRR